MDRAAVLAATFARAAGRPVYGFATGVWRVECVSRDWWVRAPKGGAGWTPAEVGEPVDWISVEGDSEWTKLPLPAGKGVRG